MKKNIINSRTKKSWKINFTISNNRAPIKQ